MKNITKTILIALVLILNIELQTSSLQAQDIHFSQFTMTSVLLDPSQAGKFGGDDRAILNYRDQWRSVASPYKTYGFSYDLGFNRQHQRDNFFGLGISAFSDKAGDINLGSTFLNLSLAYHIRLNKDSYLSAGAKGGFMQRSVDDSQFRFDNQFDGSGHNDAYASGELLSNNSFFAPDFSVGLSYSYGTITNNVISNNGFDNTKINVGFAIHNVSNPGYSFFDKGNENLNFRYVLHTNTSFGVRGSNMALQPSGFIAFQQNATDIVFGTFFRYNLKEKSKFTKFSNGAAFSIGAHYRLADAFIPSLLIETGAFAFGLSYDLNISGLTPVSNGNGGFEVSVRYISPNPFGRKRSAARFF